LHFFIWCTEASRGDKVAINLDLVAAMARGKIKTAQGQEVECTNLYYGSIAVTLQGAAAYGLTAVLETPEQILITPRIESAPIRPAVKTGRK